ncbi:MAG: thioredoxin [Paracoccaceae bacterium]
MLELNPNASATPAGDLIKDTSEATFMADVIEASQETPIIVDFWAPWCGPCKQLTPALEAAITDAKGAVKLVKVNVDENQAIAGQLRVQSIPTVYAFWKGQPIDAFQGAVPASELKAFIDRAIEASGGEAGGGLEEAIETAEQMLSEGAASDAAQIFAAVMQEDANNAAAYGGLARAYLELDQTDQATGVLASVPDEIAEAPEIEAARAQIALAKQAEDAGPVAELRAAVEADADDHQARFDLAQALYAAGEGEEAIDQFLELFRRDREWNGGAAKEQLMTVFDALKPNDPLVLNGRRKLSSMIFA